MQVFLGKGFWGKRTEGNHIYSIVKDVSFKCPGFQHRVGLSLDVSYFARLTLLILADRHFHCQTLEIQAVPNIKLLLITSSPKAATSEIFECRVVYC